jgi:S1-C subfamily serine protease
MKNKIIALLCIVAISIPSFSIVNSNYQTAIDYVVSKKYMSYSNKSFNGDKFVTRNELAQTIYNMKSQELNWINTTTKVLPNVVVVECSNKVGSGVLLDNIHVLSCYHILSEEGDILVRGDINSSIATIIAYDVDKDLVLLKLNNKISNVNALKLSKYIDQSQEVITIGMPMNNIKSVTKGIISKLEYKGYNLEKIQFSMISNFGNSGGAVFDINGDIVSIVTHKVDESIGYGISFGVKPYDLYEFLKKHL